MAGLLIGIGAMTHSPFRTAVGCCARNGAALITRTDSRVSSHRILNIKSVQAATSKNIAKHRVERTGWRAHHKQRLFVGTGTTTPSARLMDAPQNLLERAATPPGQEGPSLILDDRCDN